MNKMRKTAGLFFPILVIGAFFALKFWAQETCVEYPLVFRETFDTTDYRDDVNSSVDKWGLGYVILNKTGEEFAISNPNYIPIWINTVTANDFDLDGWTDLVGSSSSYNNVLAFVRNMGKEGQIGTFTITQWIAGTGSGGTPTRGYNGEPIDTSGHCGLTSGDYDGDGDFDFLFIVSSDNPPNFTIKRIWLYRNNLKETGTLSFTQINKTSAWTATIKGIAWSATMMQSVDLNNDGALDIIMGNRAGEVIRINNNNRTRALDRSNKFTLSVLLTSARTGWGTRGVSTVSIADFDKDNDLDMILGSVSYSTLQYWKNDGTGNFGTSPFKTYTDPSKNPHDAYYDGAATASIAYDFNRDGWQDLIIGTDDWNYDTDSIQDNYGGTGIGGQCYYFKNNGKGDFIQKLLFDGQLATPTVWDFDLGVNWDYNNDGLMDFLIADGNHSEKYYLFINGMADVYNLFGLAQSINITPSLDPNLYAITKVKIKNLDQSVIGGSSAGLEVTYYVSNNDGKDWEFYARFPAGEIRTYAELPWHTFVNYGSKLRWKAELTATDDNIPEFPNSSYETPKIDNIEFDIIYVDRREYSRTSVAATIVDDSGQRVELIIGGTFYFPGWQGHLFAYDVSAMTPVNSTYSELRTLSRSDLSSPTGREIVASGVTIRWDAGSLLNSRTPESRVIYTAIPDAGGTLNRMDFTAANVGALETYLDDFQDDNVGLIGFVRGTDRDWKLGDINHSNPVVVGAPNGDALQMGLGYDAFKTALADRRKVLYVGANDGMLHCFDVLTGEELWGFIPYNLLPKLKNMWAVDQTTLGERYFYRDVYVDGSPAVGDVLIDGEWKTILVCGQGPGKGSVIGQGEGINYYFALDVTNPANPIPLWELTHATMGETWSVPAIAKVTKDGMETWVAFVGSGYDNSDDNVLGNVLYAIDLEGGSIFWTFTADEVDTSAVLPNIQNTMPGSPAVVDVDRNGFADRVYIGDLDGRMWRIDVSLGFEDENSWETESVYTDPANYPIITKPAVWKNPNVQTADPRIYFGTGGDDRAPSLATYSFIALVDTGTGANIEWYLGNESGTARPAEKKIGDLAVGEKVWADPKIEDYIVYFSTLTGSIESVDACANLAGLGKLYARFVISVAGTPVGGTAFKTASGAMESLDLAIKTRSAVTLGEQETTTTGVKKRDVYIQEYNSTIQRLEQLTGGVLKVKSWREVYKIYKEQ